MMITRLALTFALASAAVLAGCGSNVKLDENANKPAPVVDRGPSTPPPPATSGQLPGERSVAQVDLGASKDPLNDPNGPLAKRSVYFDYDSFVVKDDFRGLVEAHSRYLVTNKTRKIVIQGNTDERGGREYNLALGQKRAEAVRKAMMALGVGDNQIESVSFGEEKPKAQSSDEAAFAENRRADLAYQ